MRAEANNFSANILELYGDLMKFQQTKYWSRTPQLVWGMEEGNAEVSDSCQLRRIWRVSRDKLLRFSMNHRLMSRGSWLTREVKYGGKIRRSGFTRSWELRASTWALAWEFHHWLLIQLSWFGKVALNMPSSGKPSHLSRHCTIILLGNDMDNRKSFQKLGHRFLKIFNRAMICLHETQLVRKLS